MAEPKSDQRKYLRFEPDAGDYVQIDKNAETESFHCDEVGLLVEESPMGGFGLVCLTKAGLSPGSIYRFRVGRLTPLKAKVIWSKQLDDKVSRYGLSFLE